MKRKLTQCLLIFSLLIPTILRSQVTIGSGTAPVEGTLLELKEKENEEGDEGKANSTKGLGMPRVELQEINKLEPCAVTTPGNKKLHVGLVVYNTKITTDLQKGMYSWNGEMWNLLAGGAWYDVKNQKPAIDNDRSAYLMGAAAIGINTPIDKDAQLSVQGNTVLRSTPATGTAALDIEVPKGNMIKLVDNSSLGSPQGKVLTSDAFGVGSWQTLGTAVANLGVLQVNRGENWYEEMRNTPTNNETNSTAYSGTFIDLPIGYYQINFSMWVSVVNGKTGARPFAAVFLSKEQNNASKAVRPTALTNVESIILNPTYASSVSDYYGSGAIPISITQDDVDQYGDANIGEVPGYPHYVKPSKTVRVFLQLYVSPDSFGTGTNAINVRNHSPGYFGPYTQLYALPFSISQDQIDMQQP